MVLTVATTVAVGGTPSVVADSPAIAVLPTSFPSYFYLRWGPGHASGETVAQTVVDAQNRLVFEYDFVAPVSCAFNSSAPPNLVAYNADTRQLVATGCIAAGSGGDLDAPQRNQTYAGSIAVDPVDRLLFLAASFPLSGYNQLQPNNQVGHVDVYSEDTLKRVASLDLPLTYQALTPDVIAVSWSRLDDELIVMADGGEQNAPPDNVPAVSVLAYQIPKLQLPRGGSAAPVELMPQQLWSAAPLGKCGGGGMLTWFVEASAHRSQIEPKVFVPCVFSQTVSTSNLQTRTTGVLTIHLAPNGRGGVCDDLGAPPGIECPNTANSGQAEYETAAAPAEAEDFLFDEGSDRAYLPCCWQGNSDTNIYVYDGRTNNFLGATNIGSVGSSKGISMGLDPRTGRLYAFTPSRLVYVVDGRRTQIPRGDTFLIGPSHPLGNNYELAVLPQDDKGHPTTLLVPNGVAGSDCPSGGACHPGPFLMYADQYPVSQDPPGAKVDSNTYGGQLSPGVALAAAYDGTARGYAVHSDLVGGLQGVIQTASGAEYDAAGAPLAQGSRDIFTGVVDRATLSGGSAQARASAAEPADNLTAAYYRRCTDQATLYGGCSTAPCGTIDAGVTEFAPSAVSTVDPACTNPRGVVPTPPALPSPVPSLPPPPVTRQIWPLPEAACSYPGATAPKATADGVRVTTGYQSDGTPVFVTVPGSTEFASAAVDCRPADNGVQGSSGVGGDGSASALALLAKLAGDVVEVGSSTTTTSVEPAASAAPLTSMTNVVVHRLHVSLPNSSDGGANSIDIGNIQHTARAEAHGRTGTASTMNRVDIADVVLTQDGHTIIVCGSSETPVAFSPASMVPVAPPPAAATSCTVGSVVNAINGAFPYFVRAESPTADSEYATDQSHGNASPGGFEAIVQSNLNEQYGDQVFNGMSSEEASYLPALRLVLYSDHLQGLTREVLDIAGVEDEAQFGFLPPTATGCFGCNEFPPVPATVPTVDVNTASYVAGVQQPVGTSGVGTGSGTGDGLSSLPGVAQRVFSGLRWLVRSPAAALQMLAFLGMLGVPLNLVARRRRWLTTIAGDQAQ